MSIYKSCKVYTNNISNAASNKMCMSYCNVYSNINACHFLTFYGAL